MRLASRHSINNDQDLPNNEESKISFASKKRRSSVQEMFELDSSEVASNPSSMEKPVFFPTDNDIEKN